MLGAEGGEDDDIVHGIQRIRRDPTDWLHGTRKERDSCFDERTGESHKVTALVCQVVIRARARRRVESEQQLERIAESRP
jgi:hypothetical protein